MSYKITPRLTAAEEIELCRKAQEGCQRSLNRIVLANIGLVKSMVGKHVQPTNPIYDDLVQEGAIGLVIAARRFDPSRGVRFGAIAYWWIKACIMKYFRLLPPGCASLDAPAQGLDNVSMLDTIPDERYSPIPERAELREDLRAAIQALPERERVVLEAYFLDSQPLRACGAYLGISFQAAGKIKESGLYKIKRCTHFRTNFHP